MYICFADHKIINLTVCKLLHAEIISPMEKQNLTMASLETIFIKAENVRGLSYNAK